MLPPTILSFWEVLMTNLLTFIRRLAVMFPSMYNTFISQPILLLVFGFFIISSVIGVYKKL